MKPYLVAFISFAGVLMSLEFSVPLMPVFYKIDFSDVPAVIALFTMGPVSGLAVEFVKILIKLITVGTNSNYVGEFSNLIAAVMFILPIWFISRKMPATKKGRIIYGVGCGLITVFIRYFGGYSEGVSFAILIMNLLVWYIDQYTRPRVFGVRKAKKKEKEAA